MAAIILMITGPVLVLLGGLVLKRLDKSESNKPQVQAGGRRAGGAMSGEEGSQNG